MYNDKNLTCADCGQEFVFTASEQDFYAQRGFTEPRRCPSCRASRKAARNARRRRQLVRRLWRRRRVFRRWHPVAATAAVATAPATAVPREMFIGDLLVLRPRGPGPVPTDQRQAGLLQRLLPEPARRLTHPLGAGRPTARRTSVIRPGPSADPGRCLSVVVRSAAARAPDPRVARSAGRSRTLGWRSLPCSLAPSARSVLAARSSDSRSASSCQLGRLPASKPRSNLRSVPWSRRSMLSAWASQISAAPTAE